MRGEGGVGSTAGRPEDGHTFKRGYLRPRWSLYRFRGCEFGVGWGCLSVRLRGDVAGALYDYYYKNNRTGYASGEERWRVKLKATCDPAG